MNNTDVPIWEKYTLTIEEASKYFRIGEKKLRKLAEENIDAGWVIVNGNRIQIKRKQFEKISGFRKQLELKKFKLFFLCIMHKEEGEENDKPRVVQSKQKEIM